MARPEKCRKICNPPKMKGFKPFGIPACSTGSVSLKFEEYESIRLINYEILSQDAAASMMNISRPTFTRIYNRALKQVAKSFVECKALVIDGGNFEFDRDWYRCRRCNKLIEGLENHFKCENCALFGKDELIKLNKTSELNIL